GRARHRVVLSLQDHPGAGARARGPAPGPAPLRGAGDHRRPARERRPGVSRLDRGGGPPMSAKLAPPSPELLYLLSGDEEDFQAAAADFLPADIAEALNGLPVAAATRVVAALPFERAVQVFDEPQLTRRGQIIAGLDPDRAIPLIEAMSSDQQVELFRELDDATRARLMHVLDPPTRETINLLMRFPPTSAGGIMTTEFVAVPANWTVEQVRDYIRQVAQAKETVYAIYVVDPVDARLLRVVSLKELMLAEPGTRVI